VPIETTQIGIDFSLRKRRELESPRRREKDQKGHWFRIRAHGLTQTVIAANTAAIASKPLLPRHKQNAVVAGA
jgi:hypothetical protein